MLDSLCVKPMQCLHPTTKPSAIILQWKIKKGHVTKHTDVCLSVSLSVGLSVSKLCSFQILVQVRHGLTSVHNMASDKPCKVMLSQGHTVLYCSYFRFRSSFSFYK